MFYFLMFKADSEVAASQKYLLAFLKCPAQEMAYPMLRSFLRNKREIKGDVL